MSTSYTEKFNVLEVFEQNPYQKIMMGAQVNNPDDVVVINVFKKGPQLAPDFLETAQNALSNVIHVEDNSDELVLVTDYQEGMSLHNYLEGVIADSEKRIALAHTYMEKTLSYDKFNNYFKSIFLDDNQIIVREDQLLLNELIIVDEQIENGHGFDQVVDKIGGTLEVIFNTGKGGSLEGQTKEQVDAFLNSLKVNSGVYNNLEELVTAFKKTFIYEADSNDKAVPPIVGAVGTPSDASTSTASTDQAKESADASDSEDKRNDSETNQEDPRKKEVELEGLEVVNEIFDEADDAPDKKRNAGPLALILIALALVAAIFAFANPFADKESKLPEASFVRQEIDGKLHFKNTSQAYGKDNSIVMSEWSVFSVSENGKKKLKTSEDDNLDLIIKNSGTYRVELKVQDENKQWSLPASEEFNYVVDNMTDFDDDENSTANPQEKLSKYLIEYTDENISKDTNLYRSGTESIKMDLSQGDAQITMKDLEMESNSIISMWLLSDGTEPVNIQFKGYKNGNLVFTKDVKHVPRAANIWEMVESKVSASGVDSMQITFSGQDTIWIDDIDISSYK